MAGRARQHGCLSRRTRVTSAAALALKGRAQAVRCSGVSDENRAPKAWLLAAAVAEFKHTACAPCQGQAAKPFPDFQRQALQSTWAAPLRHGQRLPDMPEVSKTWLLAASKGFGYPSLWLSVVLTMTSSWGTM